LAEKVGQANGEYVEAADEQSWPLPAISAREHQADDAQHDARDERRATWNDRRDQAGAADVLRSRVRHRDCERVADQCR
jgi:hypothetical protein